MTSLSAISQEYQAAVFDTDRDRAIAIVERALAAGITPEQVVFEIVVPGVESMMRSIAEDFDANLAQHFMTAQIASQITERMLPLFQQPPKSVGRIVLGTAKGDLHSLGKRILTGCLRSLMVEAIDLGVNVAPERFVDAALEHDARVIGVSAMMMHTAQGPDGPRGVRRILEERRLERRIKLVVGGAPFRFDPELAFAVGADAWAPDGITAGRVIVSLLGGAAS